MLAGLGRCKKYTIASESQVFSCFDWIQNLELNMLKPRKLFIWLALLFHVALSMADCPDYGEYTKRMLYRAYVQLTGIKLLSSF